VTPPGDDPPFDESEPSPEDEAREGPEAADGLGLDGLGWEVDPDEEVVIDDVGDDEDDDLDAEHALHCPHHGWHPLLLDVVLRLRVLTGDDPDGGTRAALLAAGAHEAEDHLVGSLSGAIEALRAVEARALEAMLPL
jgi:hypothetical protein